MIKRIIFLKNREGSKFQTTTELAPHSLFQIYPSGYKKVSDEMRIFIVGLVKPTLYHEFVKNSRIKMN